MHTRIAGATQLLAGLVVLVMCLTGCAARSTLPTQDIGSATAATATPRPTSSATATSAATPGTPPADHRTLTTADNGTTIRLLPHQTVTVILVSHEMFSWHIPTATGTSVTLVNAQGGYPETQPAQAVFIAVHPGDTLLTATDDTACLHTQPACLPPQQMWQATIVVG
jgi:hypothetical protein